MKKDPKKIRCPNCGKVFFQHTASLMCASCELIAISGGR